MDCSDSPRMLQQHHKPATSNNERDKGLWYMGKYLHVSSQVADIPKLEIYHLHLLLIQNPEPASNNTVQVYSPEGLQLFK